MDTNRKYFLKCVCVRGSRYDTVHSTLGHNMIQTAVSSTWYSQAVPHPSTLLAQCCLTFVFTRELVNPSILARPLALKTSQHLPYDGSSRSVYCSVILNSLSSDQCSILFPRSLSAILIGLHFFIMIYRQETHSHSLP